MRKYTPKHGQIWRAVGNSAQIRLKKYINYFVPSPSFYKFLHGIIVIRSRLAADRTICHRHRRISQCGRFPSLRISGLALSCQLVPQIMERRRWLKVGILMCLFALSAGRELKAKNKNALPIYNHTLARILVEYSSAVYMSDLTELFTWTCSRCNDLTKGFEMIELIVDVQACLQAFVGVAQDLNAIVIAFRGTQGQSIQNWIEDLYWKQLDCDYPGTSDAMVHHGFYSAYHNTTLRPGILDAVKSAKELYGDLQIMVTGHSMGGAMASFCGLDLTVNFGVQNVLVMTFGQPRVGNAAFASYYSQLVPNTFRVVNEHDIVPHLPPFFYFFPKKTYHHFPREVWLHNTGIGTLIYLVETVCDGSGEDPNCSRSVSGNSIADHLTYYGVEMGCDDSVTCRMVMDPHLAAYSTIDQGGNFILSRNCSTAVLKMNKGSGVQNTII